MNAVWQKWFYLNLDMLIRHVGTAGMASLATLYVNGAWNLKSFAYGLLAGAVLPTVFTVFQRGLPKIFGDTNTTDETKT